MMASSHKRPGFTLMEMLVLMPVITALMLIVIFWIQSTMKFAGRIKQQRQHHRSLMRLVEDLREDFSEGESASLKNSKLLTIQTNESSTSQYEIVDSGIHFKSWVDGELIRQELYHLHPVAVPEWQSKSSNETFELKIYRGAPALVDASAVQRRFRNVIDFRTSFSVGRWKGVSE